MNSRQYVSDAIQTWHATRSQESRREVVSRIWHMADACWAVGDTHAARRWEQLACADDWQVLA